jgi:AraC family L-rhamnose operon transcriptional activator RhaR
VVAGVRLLEEDLAHEWSLPELAAIVHLNASYLARLFKSCTGRAPMAYLAHRRAELAGALLLRTNYPIARIGQETGWSDPNYFARCFRAHFGMSARAYRERHGVAGSKPDHTHRYIWETAPLERP